MDEGQTIRLFRFRPRSAAIDVTLRDAVAPALLRLPGIRDIFLARHGADGGDERVVFSVWASDAAPARTLEAELLGDAVGESDDLADGGLDVLPVRIALAHDGRTGPTVLRIFRGRVRDGAFDAYVTAARTGALFDGATNAGAVALYLAAADGPEFMTVSAWTEWQAVEQATGGDVRRPFATRHRELLERVDAAHYEIIPDVPRPHGAGEAATGR